MNSVHRDCFRFWFQVIIKFDSIQTIPVDVNFFLGVQKISNSSQKLPIPEITFLAKNLRTGSIDLEIILFDSFLYILLGDVI